MRLARVPGRLLKHRLDGAYYNPLALRLDARLRQFGNAHALESLRDEQRPITNGVRGPEFAESSFKLIRLQDCVDWEVRPDLALSISDKQFKENARCRLRRDDVVVAIGGYVGNAAIVIDDAAAVIGQHSARVSLSASGPLNTRFLVAYLNAEPGRIQFARLMRGTVQQGLNLEDVQEIAVPVFSPLAQRYVGDKVRQAERLRQRARTLVVSARLLVASLLERLIDERSLVALLERGPCEADLRTLAEKVCIRPKRASIDAHRETKHTNRISSAALGTLWTAPSYRREITDAVAHLRSGRWQPLGALCRDPVVQGRTPMYATNGAGYPCLKTRHVNGLFVDDSEPDLVTFECAEELARFKVSPETILMNRSGAGSVGRCAVYLSGASPLTNEHLLHIKLEAAHDPCFVTLFLSSWWGERAIEQGITGSTGQLNLPNEHVSRIPVPMVQWDVQSGLGSLIRKAAACAIQARALVAATKALVEQLIDGRVTEADLVAAQKALEAGDRSVDRTILQALRQSDAPNAKTLIADLDALYALLDASEENEG
jgi:type I restriction enzyme S subunit